MRDLKDDIRCILLDIEGTTSSISFVHDVMFPFVLDRLDEFLDQHYNQEDVQAACTQIAADAGHTSLDDWGRSVAGESELDLLKAEIRRLMAGDVKATGLKALQGLIWKGGFESGQLQAHVYPDVIPAMRRWKDAGIDVRIYSSGSVAAQRLFFGHLQHFGDCLELISGHYDTRIGNKKAGDSYRRIAADWNVVPANVLFVSDIDQELAAASQAGFQVCASIRPGNTDLDPQASWVRITSFDQIK